MRITCGCACLAVALVTACGRAEEPLARQVSPAALEAVERRMEQDPERAADELVTLVVASVAEVPREELRRLGRVLLERSDREVVLDRLRQACLAHPESRSLQEWLRDLEEWNELVIRGIDVDVGYTR